MSSPSEVVRRALRKTRTVDISTTGRRSGRTHRVEIWLYSVDGRFFLTGLPGRRDWYANLAANPRFTLHLTGRPRADLPAEARAITDQAERRRILGQLLSRRGSGDLEAWIARSPLVEVTVEPREPEEDALPTGSAK